MVESCLPSWDLVGIWDLVEKLSGHLLVFNREIPPDPRSHGSHESHDGSHGSSFARRVTHRFSRTRPRRCRDRVNPPGLRPETRGIRVIEELTFPWHSPDDLTSIFSIASDKLRVCYGKWSIDRLDRWFAFEKWWFSVALKHQRVSQLPWRLLGDLKKQFFAYRNRCVFWRFHHQSMNWQGFLWNHQNHGPSLSQKITQNMGSAHSWIPLRKPSFSTKWGPLDS